MRASPSQVTQRIAKKSALPGAWLFYFIAIMGIFVSLLLWYASVIESKTNLSHSISLQTQDVANSIQSQIDLRITALKHMAKHLSEEANPSYSDWQNNVVAYVKEYGGFKGVAYLNAAFKPTWVTPDLPIMQKVFARFIDQYGASLTANIASHGAWMSPAMTADGTEQGFFLAVPISQTIGGPSYLVSLVNLKEALNIRINHDDYFVTVYDNTEKIYADGPIPPPPLFPAQTASIDIHGIIWTVHVQPTPHLVAMLRNGLPNVILILGICISVLFGIATHLAQLARQRAVSLDKINEDLVKEITERLEAETSKQKLEKAMLQGQKLQAIGTLAGGIAHDFNNLLYAIIGYVEMAREDVAKDSLIYKNLGNVLEASHRGRELIARILAFSRRQYHEFKPILIQATIESVLALLQPTVPASVKINFAVALPENFTVLGDPTRLHQIIVNITNNAVDAMDEEGEVNITLSLVKANDELLNQFPDRRESDYCRIEISDSGHGMDQTTVDRIFEPFFTTKEVGRGTGLGLATVHTIVKEHNGEIWVTSQLGRGASFIILLPEYKGERSNG